MKCELCHQADAETVLYRPAGPGRSEELYVCKACAAREQIFDRERGIQVTAMDPGAPFPSPPGQEPHSLEDLKAMGIPPKELFGKLGEMFGEMSRRFPADDEAGDNLICPSCGASFNDLRSGGLMGCADCYTAFEKVLPPLLDELHLCSEHTGDGALARQREIAQLNRELFEALRREDYPAAKRIKAQLAKLLSEGKADCDGP